MSGKRIDITKAAMLILFLSFAGLIGCAEKLPPPVPIKAQLDADVANLWYYEWSKQDDIPCEGIADMLFVFVYRGRDWSEPEGVDGYVLRVIMLDKKQKAIRGDGWLKIFAVENSDSENAKAFAAWSISPQQLKSYYQEERFPCYLFPLDWGVGPDFSKGMFTIVVRWESADQKARYTRVIELEDLVAHEVRTIRKKLPSAVPVNRVNSGASSDNNDSPKQ